MPSDADLEVKVSVDLSDLRSMSDEELFRALQFLGAEVQHRTNSAKFMGKINPDRLYLFPLGLFVVMIGDGKVLDTADAMVIAGGKTRQTILDGVASTFNPLQYVKIGQFGERNKPLFFLRHWIEEWRLNMRTGRGDRK